LLSLQKKFATAIVVAITLSGIGIPRMPASAWAASANDPVRPDGLDRRFPEVRFDAVACVDAFDFLRDLTGANIYVDWTALNAAGVKKETPVTYLAHDRKFGDLLTELLAQAGKGLEYQLHDSVIVISSSKQFDLEKSQPGPDLRAIKDSSDPALSDADRKAAKALERHLPEIKFDAVPFTDVVDFLRDITGMNINVNWRAIEAAGIDRQTPVSLRFHAVKCSVDLSFVLKAAGNGKL
jgi:hypothetical protein